MKIGTTIIITRKGNNNNCEALQLESSLQVAMPVILSFNYEAHTAPAYKFNNSAIICR